MFSLVTEIKGGLPTSVFMHLINAIKTRSDRKIHEVRKQKKKKKKVVTGHIQVSPHWASTRAAAATPICQDTQTLWDLWLRDLPPSPHLRGDKVWCHCRWPQLLCTRSLTSGPLAGSERWPLATTRTPACLWKTPLSSLPGLLCVVSLAGQRPELLWAETSVGDTCNGITLRFSRWKTPRLDYVIIFNCNSSMK